MGEERIGDWIQTFTGKRFWPFDPRPEDVCLEDIAHALALICRFNGHSRRFYSVAEHSLLVMRHVKAKFRPWALLHDAAEAYLADVPRPLKHSPAMELYRQSEERVYGAILDRFDLCFWVPAAVKRADSVALVTERRDLLASSESLWEPALEELEAFEENLPWDAPYGIEQQFLDDAHFLGIQ